MALQEEMYKDLKKNKGLLITALLIVLLIIGIFIYKLIYEPIKIGDVEVNQNKVKHDTTSITSVIHDTIVKPTNEPPTIIKTQPAKTNVISINQKGGQTAESIINNK